MILKKGTLIFRGSFVGIALSDGVQNDPTVGTMQSLMPSLELKDDRGRAKTPPKFDVHDDHPNCVTRCVCVCVCVCVCLCV